MTKLRVIFMGTPDFAVPSLAALIGAGHDVVGVYSQPPRPAGRGHREQLSPVHAFAAQRGLLVRTPARLKDPAEHRAFAELAADVAVVAAYGLILPKPILDAPRLGCVNVHASLLPRWRGAAPIQRAILAGDAESGVTIMGMEEGLDTGPMWLIGRAPISARTTGASLHDGLSRLGGELIVPALAGIADRRLSPIPQPADGVTYAKKLERDEGRMDWSRPAVELERQVRAFAPWPGAWFEHRGERIKVLESVMTTGQGAPGTIIDDGLAVACGAGALRLSSVQRAGKAAMAAEAFLRGYALPKGTRLA